MCAGPDVDNHIREVRVWVGLGGRQQRTVEH